MSEENKTTATSGTQAADGNGQTTQTQATPTQQAGQQANAQPAASQAPDTTGLDAIKKELAASRKQAAELQAKITAQEHDKATKDGDLKKVLKLEQEAKAKLQSELEQLKTEAVKIKVRSAIEQTAKDAHNIDHLLKLGDVDKITVVDGTVYGVNEFVQGLRKDAPHLFKIQDVNAGPKVGPTSDKPKLSEDYFKELGKQKTAAGVAAVRKKFGVDSGESKIMIDGRLQ